MRFNRINIFNHKKNQIGFTLIEMIVALFAFSIILTIVGSVFIHALVSQRRALNAQKVEENLSFVMEFMTRELRVAQPQIKPTQESNFLTSSDQLNDACTALSPAAVSSLDFWNSSGQHIKYSLVDNALHRAVDANQDGDFTDNNEDSIMSSLNVQFTQLRFCLNGFNTGDNNKQARITILTSVQDSLVNPQIKDDYQTTVSLRFLGI